MSMKNISLKKKKKQTHTGLIIKKKVKIAMFISRREKFDVC